MKNLSLFSKFISISVYAVAEAGSDCNDKITFSNTHVTCLSSVHSHHPGTKRIVSREAVAGHQTFAYRNLSLCSKIKKFSFSARDFYTTAGINNRTFCFINQISRNLKLLLIRFLYSNNAADIFVSVCKNLSIINVFQRFKISFCRSNILRNINQNRSRTSSLRNCKSLADSLSQVFNIHYDKIVFGNRHCNAGDINFLEGILAKKRTAYVTGNCNHRNRIHISSSNTGYQVSCARTRSSHTNTNAACRTSITISRMSRPLLVCRQNMSQTTFVLIKLIINIKNGSSRVSEHFINALFNKTFNYNLRTVKFQNQPRY